MAGPVGLDNASKSSLQWVAQKLEIPEYWSSLSLNKPQLADLIVNKLEGGHNFNTEMKWKNKKT